MHANPVGKKIMKPKFRWLDFDALLERLKVTHSDLVPVGQLPTPDESYVALVREGKSHFVIDLGTSYLTPWVQPKRQHIFDFGVSY